MWQQNPCTPASNKVQGTPVVIAGLEGDGTDDDLVVHRRKRRSGEQPHPEDPLSPSNASKYVYGR
jgi:hypothetical protein